MTKLFFACTFSALLAANTLCAQSLLAIDFADAKAQSYKDGDTIGFANDSAGQMTIRQEVPNIEIRVADAGGKNALEFISDGAQWGQAGAVKTIPLDIAQKDSLVLHGSVVFTPLEVSGARGIFQIAINSGNWITTSSSVTAVHLSLESNLGLKYVSGTGSKSAAKLEAGSRYRIDFSADFSDPQQNTWEFTLSLEDGGVEIYSSGPMPTRAPHIAPGLFALGCGVGTGTSADPFVQIHSVKLSESAVEKTAVSARK